MTDKLKAMEERINQKQAKLNELKAELKRKQQQQKATIKERERRNDTRRKILIGAYFLEQVKKGLVSETELKLRLATFLTKDSDRKLFNLPPIEKAQTETPKPNTETIRSQAERIISMVQNKTQQ